MKFEWQFIVMVVAATVKVLHSAPLEQAFQNPPDSSRPGVYWYFMDGNLSREGMTADLESMKSAGIGNLVFLEVNVRVPRGPMEFMSEPWQVLFAHAVDESRRLGIDITLGTGPGWSGSGGPWVKPEQSMQHLLFSEVEATGPGMIDRVMPVPEQRSTRWHNMRSDFYRDVAVFAFPRCKSAITDIDEKALYVRNPYSSMQGVKSTLPALAEYPQVDAQYRISVEQIQDISRHMDADGRLRWEVPAGEWTILRMVSRPTGASSRPAPAPGIGLECDKLDAAAFDAHFDQFIGRLLKKVGPRLGEHGWTTLHMDSWEMGAQNWTQDFCREFKARRGYDPAPYLPAYSGRVIESVEITERFLWDIRLTCQELVLENHAGRLKELGRRHGFDLSIEPYDMNPTADLDLGAVADVPMGEFWGAGYGFDSSFSCIEAASVAHTMGRPIVAAEAFTGRDNWLQYPWTMKNQGDWAFCMGINRFVYHTFAHKPLGEAHWPGMTMGPYGVHWDRKQTWWPMVGDYHRYVSRCSYLMRQGVTVSDILYLTPEGAPHVFRPPGSALEGSGPLADKKGYGFDGCSPNILKDRASVRNGKIVFPGGTSYALMVLPDFKTMTPEFLETIERLVREGAVIVGSPAQKSPSLSGFPGCDETVRLFSTQLWGSLEKPAEMTRRNYGRGAVYWGGIVSPPQGQLYPTYDSAAVVLKQLGIREDFSSTGPVRYGHRTTEQQEIYFISNKSPDAVEADCTFRVADSTPQLWDPVTGQIRILPQAATENGLTTIPMKFAPYQSFFVMFPHTAPRPKTAAAAVNFPPVSPRQDLGGAWTVCFDPRWGGPEQVVFETLQDWTSHADEGIRYYSGIATYRKQFDRVGMEKEHGRIFLDLGKVHDIARVRLNGQDMGVAWCAPWRVEITDALQPTDNRLEIEVANRWPNRLIGDQQPQNRDVRTIKWDNGLLEGKAWPAGRYTFTTNSHYKADMPLLPSGLLGPVAILAEDAYADKTPD